jgi:hypothetical protein
MTSKIIHIVVTLVLIWINSSGQPSVQSPATNCPQEKIQVHLSHESAFTGEICWFKIYCTSPLYPGDEISNLAFFELVGSENTSIIRKKILLTNGAGAGDFEIPDNLPTGLYYVLAYTSWMKNFGEDSFFRKEFVIINPSRPFNNLSDSAVLSGKKEETVPTTFHAQGAEVIPDQDQYSTREKVTLTIKSGEMSGKTISGNLSVSVYRKEPRMIFGKGNIPETSAIRDPQNILYRPDYKGIWLSGKTADPSGQVVSGIPVILSLPGYGTDIKREMTDSKGYFHFLLKPKQGEQDIVITLPDAGTKIDLEESYWNGFRNPPDNRVFVLSRNSIDYLKEKFAHFQFQGRFKKFNYVKNPPFQNAADSSVFYSKPFQSVKMSNYVNLDSLREYFYELVPSVKFTQRRGEFNISVIDQQTQVPTEDKPGVFLDGVLYDNYALIAGIPSGEIDRMAILPSTYYYKDLTFGGIVDIHTKKSDFGIVKPLPEMTRFLFPMANASEWTFASPDYTVEDSLDRKPDFRYLLHWEPNVKTNDAGEGAVSFYTGDVMGTFDIKVVGINAAGEIIQAENEIHVGD